MLSTPTPDAAAFAPIAGFWRRVAAFVVDGVVIGCIGYLLGLALFDVFVRMGPWGRGVGFLVALVYFVSQEGARGGGRSLGKRLLRIRVVDSQGRALDPARGAARFAVLSVPYFVIGAALPVDVVTFAGGFPLASLTLGGLLALAWLLSFNRRTRQSLHDLAVGAFVVRAGAGAPGAPGPARTWRGHVVIAAVLLLLAGATPLLHPSVLPLRALHDRLAMQPELRSVNVFASNARLYGTHDDTRADHALFIEATIIKPLDDYVPLSTRIAGIALAAWPDAKLQDRISVRLAHGFDIGVASNWGANTLSLTPDQWADRVAAGLAGPAN